VLLLDAEPDLASGLEPTLEAEARRHLKAPVARLAQGPWDPRLSPSAGSPHCGFLILEGLLAREVVLAAGASVELLGSGDLVEPPTRAEVDEPGAAVFWTALQPTSLAVLDAPVVLALCCWPTVVSELIARAAARSSRLAVQRTISQVTGVQARLMLLFSHLAERWGHVSPDGVVLPLRLSHELIARLVGATRTSVTTALSRLRAEELLGPAPGGGWLLSPKLDLEMRRRIRSHHVLIS